MLDRLWGVAVYMVCAALVDTQLPSIKGHGMVYSEPTSTVDPWSDS